MLPGSARENAKSLTNWALATSIFVAQQGWNIVTGMSSAQTRFTQTNDALERVSWEMECSCADTGQGGRPLPFEAFSGGYGAVPFVMSPVMSPFAGAGRSGSST